MIKILIVFLAAFVGGMMPLQFGKHENFMRFALPFSASMLLTVCLVHILPDSVEEIGHEAGIYILLGFLLQLFLEKFSHGVEHGHSHIPVRFSQSVFIGLALHAFVEGAPLSFNFRNDMVEKDLVAGLSIHKLTAAFTLGVFLLNEPIRKSKYIQRILIFAFVTPLSAFIFTYLAESFRFITSVLPNFVALAMGSLLWISTTIFYESEGKNHSLPRIKIIAIATGILSILLVDYLGGHMH